MITGITGIFDGSNITGLSTLGGANNKVYEPAPFLDDFGLSFSVAGGPDVNVFFNDPTYFVQVRGGAQLDQVTFTLTAVPEPGSLSLLGTALIGFGSFKLRRFRRNVRGDASRRLARPELC